MYKMYGQDYVHFVVSPQQQNNGANEMTNENPLSENGIIHKFVLSMDRIINTLEYAESDQDTGYKPASLIRVCINQMTSDLHSLNKKVGSDWPENK